MSAKISDSSLLLLNYFVNACVIFCQYAGGIDQTGAWCKRFSYLKEFQLSPLSLPLSQNGLTLWYWLTEVVLETVC